MGKSDRFLIASAEILSSCELKYSTSRRHGSGDSGMLENICIWNDFCYWSGPGSARRGVVCVLSPLRYECCLFQLTTVLDFILADIKLLYAHGRQVCISVSALYVSTKFE